MLGYLAPQSFLGGRMTLDAEAAEQALRALGAEIGLDASETAWGIHSIVCENMAAATRAHIIESGRDPRAFSIVAFGGAGPGHAARVARILGVREVVVPPASGAASAVGFLAAAPSFDTVRSALFTIDDEGKLRANAYPGPIYVSASYDAADFSPNAGDAAQRILDLRIAAVRLCHELIKRRPNDENVRKWIDDGERDPLPEVRLAAAANA